MQSIIQQHLSFKLSPLSFNSSHEHEGYRLPYHSTVHWSALLWICASPEEILYNLFPMCLRRDQCFIFCDLWPVHGGNHLQKVIPYIPLLCVATFPLGVNVQMQSENSFKLLQHLNETIVSREQETDSSNRSRGIFSCCRMGNISTKNDCWHI